MNLVNDFLKLELPQIDNPNFFNTKTLDGFSFTKVGINSLGFPAIIISSRVDKIDVSRRNIRLKFIELTHNVDCEISENGKIRDDNFTIIIFKSNDESLQKYFLEMITPIINALSKNPTQKEVYNIFKNFIDIFRSLAEIPTKSIQGLWAELFIIERAKEPSALINYWHNNPNEKFDFNADKEKLEIKSNSFLDRVHIFSSEQLNPKNESQVIIASVFTKQVSNGLNVLDLLERIISALPDDELHEKLYRTISTALGTSIEQTVKIKYDYQLAISSLRFYKHQDISKIEKINIPVKVSEVKFKSDLTDLVPIDISKIKPLGKLFPYI